MFQNKHTSIWSDNNGNIKNKKYKMRKIADWTRWLNEKKLVIMQHIIIIIVFFAFAAPV